MLTKTKIQNLTLQIKTANKQSVELFLDLDEQTQADVVGMMIEKYSNQVIEKLFEQIIIKLKHQKPTKKQIIKNQVILASTSLRRQYILKEILKVPYTSLSSPSAECQPRFYKNRSTVTKTIASIKLIALMKQQKLIGQAVISSDTLVYLPNGLVLGKLQEKTVSKQIKEAQNILLNILPGKKHFISTTVIVLDLIKNKFHLQEFSEEIKFKKLTPEIKKVLNWYINLLKKNIPGRGPAGKAGAYAIQEPEILSNIEYVKGDPFAIIGLPIETTNKLLKKCGIKTAFKKPQISDLYETVWGASQWKDQEVKTTEPALENNFVPMAMKKIKNSVY